MPPKGSPPISAPPGKRLIVTADDFGVDVAVNEAVELAYNEGILTCASLMVGGRAVVDAVDRTRRMKGLGVGLHITLADGRPVSQRRNVRSLIDHEGRFKNTLVSSGVSWFFNPIVRHQLAREIDAQFRAFIATGLVMDHVNVHKHLHFHPTVAAMIISIGRRYGMLAVRVPDEPRDILMKAEPGVDVPKSRLKPLLWLLRRRMTRARLLQNDNVFGLAWTGAMTEDRLLALITHLPEGLNEIYSHPATADAKDMRRGVRGYKYREELAALMSPRVRQALIANNVTLARFSGSLNKG
ncbi:MAG: ChbG/HpnK family deacetylase [Rhodospirillales bacterium]|nr:ChbG/HpnK family deacetylase [Rhodospirillales bacterium]